MKVYLRCIITLSNDVRQGKNGIWSMWFSHEDEVKDKKVHSWAVGRFILRLHFLGSVIVKCIFMWMPGNKSSIIYFARPKIN